MRSASMTGGCAVAMDSNLSPHRYACFYRYTSLLKDAAIGCDSRHFYRRTQTLVKRSFPTALFGRTDPVTKDLSCGRPGLARSGKIDDGTAYRRAKGICRTKL